MTSYDLLRSLLRARGSDRNGNDFSFATRLAVWNKAMIVPGFDPNVRRKDAGGAWIEWAKYGDIQEGGAGWEIDHIMPVSKGGGDELTNLQPLQWQNNREKSDIWPFYNFPVSATS